MKGGNQGRISERRVTNKKENVSELDDDGLKKEEEEEEEAPHLKVTSSRAVCSK